MVSPRDAGAGSVQLLDIPPQIPAFPKNRVINIGLDAGGYRRPELTSMRNPGPVCCRPDANPPCREPSLANPASNPTFGSDLKVLQDPGEQVAGEGRRGKN